MKQTVLITGGAGFIGSWLVDHCVEQGYRVRVLDNLNPQVHGSKKPSYLHERVEYRFADIRDKEAVLAAVQEVDIVIHAAALTGPQQGQYQPELYEDVNVNGTKILLDAMASLPKIPRCILLSSMMVYGQKPAVPIKETDVCQPISQYGRTKLAQEELVRNAHAVFGVKVCILRLFNVYGPRQSLINPYTGVVPAFIMSALQGKPPVVYGSGSQVRDFIYIHDVVAAVGQCLHYDQTEIACFNIGTGETTAIATLANIIAAQVLGQLSARLDKILAVDIAYSCADITIAQQKLNWNPAIALPEGITNTLRWAKAQHDINRPDCAIKNLQLYGLLT